MPKERITTERMPEGFKTPKDLLRACRDLRPGEKLEARYAPAGALGERVEDRIVFTVGATEDGVFEATETRGEESVSYTYMDLVSRVKELGARGVVPCAAPETAQMPARAAVERGADRVKRETRESSIHYIQNINEKLRDRSFPSIRAKCLADTHLVERVRSLKPGASKANVEHGIRLSYMKALPPDMARGAEQLEQELVPTVAILLIHKLQSLTDEQFVTELGVPQIETLAAIVTEAQSFEIRDSDLLDALREKGIALVKLDVGSWRERAGHPRYLLTVPLYTFRVPPKQP